MPGPADLDGRYGHACFRRHRSPPMTCATKATKQRDALQRLARDPDMRERMGEAARLRLLHGYTHTHLRESLRAAYQVMLGRKAPR